MPIYDYPAHWTVEERDAVWAARNLLAHYAAEFSNLVFTDRHSDAARCKAFVERLDRVLLPGI